LKSVSVAAPETFPRLTPDNADHCPCPIEEIQDYLRLEDGDGDAHDRQLTFVRTARAFDSDYWVWEYRLESGTPCYVTVERSADGIMTCMDWNTRHFSPEEYIINQRRRTGRMQ
jgi:hypothetical protein